MRDDRRCATVTVEPWVREVEGGRGWTYWVPAYVGELEEGDWVIVESPRDNMGRRAAQSGVPILGQVTDASPPKTFRERATRWLVGKVEWDPYRALQALAPLEVEPD